MSVAALCASHTPLKDYLTPGADVEAEVCACFARVRAWIADYAPELVVVVGPDHFNGFFYHLMPGFCIGAGAQAVGDWKTPSGEFAVAADIAEAAVRAVHAGGVDTAISYRMTVDHGTTQIIDQLFDWQALPPLIPVFVNCAAPPLPPLARVIAFGTALGGYLRGLGQRVLVIGSGGLSHDPPIPGLAGADGPVRERLVNGGVLSVEARDARQQRVIADAKLQQIGTSERTPLNPDWDKQFLARIANFDFAAISAMDDAGITRDGGCGGHEIRSWIAATAAAEACGPCDARVLYYRTIPAWIAGFGVMTVTPR